VIQRAPATDRCCRMSLPHISAQRKFQERISADRSDCGSNWCLNAFWAGRWWPDEYKHVGAGDFVRKSAWSAAAPSRGPMKRKSGGGSSIM